MDTILQIGEVASLTGISTKTVRYYQTIGLLPEPQRTASGYRLYDMHDLLRLQQIRHLCSLGLSLKQIRHLLSQPAPVYEPTLRHALSSSIEELSARIVELEEHRDRLKQLLTQETLEGGAPPAELKWALELVKEHLQADFSRTSSTVWDEYVEQIQKWVTLLARFHWPNSLLKAARSLIQHVIEKKEQYRHVVELEVRFAALAFLPKDAPEVDQLIEDYVAELGRLSKTELATHASTFTLKPSHLHVFLHIAMRVVSPAQRRFLEEVVARRQAEIEQRPIPAAIKRGDIGGQDKGDCRIVCVNGQSRNK
jgi:DNA-binding transcriptional MerR regulator